MRNILIAIPLLILVEQVITETCVNSRELDSTCGTYCFNIVRPLLDHTKTLQSQIDNFTNKNQLEHQIEQKIEHKLENLRQTIEIRNSQIGRPYEQIGLKYYYIERSKTLNWFGAVHKCLSMGGHLVSIKNLLEFNAIRDNLLPHQSYWIDINDLTAEGELLSIATGLRPTYFNWHGNNPDNIKGIEHCVELWFHNDKHLMNDAPCHESKFFICEPENQ